MIFPGETVEKNEKLCYTVNCKKTKRRKLK